MQKSNLFLFSLILFAFTLGCTDKTDTTVDCTGLTPTYTADISVILSTCAIDGCHGSIATMANLNLTTYENAKSGSSNSKFLKAIKHESGVEAMPPAGFTKLSDSQIKLIECWIQNGKPE